MGREGSLGRGIAKSPSPKAVAERRNSSRLRGRCAARFHLSEWEGTVGQKLRALHGLYTILQQDSMNRVMLGLEVAIVALFVIDLVIIAVLGIK